MSSSVTRMSPSVLLARLASRHGPGLVESACMSVHGFPTAMISTKEEVEKIIKRIEK